MSKVQSRAGNLAGNAAEKGCGKRAGKLAELPPVFNGFPLLSRSEREAIFLATGKHLVYGAMVEGAPIGIQAEKDAQNPISVPSGIVRFGGLLRLYSCVVRIRRALPTYGCKGRDGTIVPNSRAYRLNMVPNGYRQPGDKTDKDYWRIALRDMANAGIDFYRPDGEYQSAHVTDIPDGWVMLVGTQSPIQSILDAPPEWCAQSEPCLNARVPVQGAGATGGLNITQQRHKRNAIREYIAEREQLGIIRAASQAEYSPIADMANSIIPAGTNRYYGILRDAIESVFTGNASAEQLRLFKDTFRTDGEGNIIYSGKVPHGASAEYAEQLRLEAERAERAEQSRRRRMRGFTDTMIADGKSIRAYAELCEQNDKDIAKLKAEIRFAGSLSIQPMNADKIAGFFPQPAEYYNG